MNVVNLGDNLTSDLPRPQRINIDQVLCLCEDVFLKPEKVSLFVGIRRIIAKVVRQGLQPGYMVIRVIKSDGPNSLFVNQEVERPVVNLLNAYDMGVKTDSFKAGGTTGGYVAEVNNGKTTPLPDARKGGMSLGASHKENGIKGIVGTDQRPIEFEGQEIILTAPVSNNTKKYEFEGKQLTGRQIASQINVENGGVAFANGGDVSACRCTGKTYQFDGNDISDYQIIEKLNSCGCEHELGYALEKQEHYDTLSRLNAGSITIDQALKEIVDDHLKENPQYYSKYN